MTTIFEKLVIDTDAKLIISKDIYNIIQKLHLKYPGVEWSGLFSWNITSGGFNTMEEINQLVIKVDGIYPLSIGSSGSVYYKLDSEVLQRFIKNNIKYFFKTNIICMSRNYFPIPIVCNLLPFLFMLNIIFTFLNHIIQ